MIHQLDEESGISQAQDGSHGANQEKIRTLADSTELEASKILEGQENLEGRAPNEETR